MVLPHRFRNALPGAVRHGMRLGIVALCIFTAACGDDAKSDATARETAHCTAALRWIVRGIGDVRIVERKTEASGKTRTVELAYALTVRDQREPPLIVRDTIQCDYPLVTAAATQASGPIAVAIRLRGRPFTNDELKRVNALVSLVGSAPASR